MCGITGMFGPGAEPATLAAMTDSLVHRGPDGWGVFFDPDGRAGLGHRRLRIIDLSPDGDQPLADATGRYHIAYNGEIYNYPELRQELGAGYRFQSDTDSEVLLAAYIKWGEKCLDKLIGMFAFIIWDKHEHKLFGARDRFGVKPFYYSLDPDGTLRVASEIKALHRGGVAREPNDKVWASYMTYGVYDHGEETFWRHARKLEPGHALTWSEAGGLGIRRWYDLRARVGEELDERPLETIKEEYAQLLRESMEFRFRSDVPVGVNLSGGLDSSALFALIRERYGDRGGINAFTFVTGDAHYDELPWVREMLGDAEYPLIQCLLRAADVPGLAQEVSVNQDEPFGGFPTLAYANLFAKARKMGIYVLLDGQGMDEQLAGYDYYAARAKVAPHVGPVQGAKSSATMDHCLADDFHDLAEPLAINGVFDSKLLNLQYRDIRYTKIPRALRFNDRASMMHSCELREPFLCHRLVEFGFRLPESLKIRDGQGKWLLRQIVGDLLPRNVSEAPKRPVQTPQREWLQHDLAPWAEECIEQALAGWGGAWFKRDAVREEWRKFKKHGRDNSFPFWQWISLGLMS